MTLEELSRYRLGLFADRATLDEALQYAHQLAAHTSDPQALITAVHVVLNTVIKVLTTEQETVI
jgi:hypothetical protein